MEEIVRLCVSLRPADLEALRDFARKDERSLSSAARFLLRRGLEAVRDKRPEKTDPAAVS